MTLLESNYYLSSILTVVFLISSSISIIGQLRPWPRTMLPQELLGLDIAARIRADTLSTTAAASDFGMLTHEPPAAVLHPRSDDDIASLVNFSYTSPLPFSVAARGHGHSVWGQASAPEGVVVEMRSMASGGGGGRISVGLPVSNVDTLMSPPYVDAGGEQLWVDVLHETLKHGLAPRSWTDYLQLTVGGTLSNAGFSGQAFRHGPQISNVFELDVITGKGEMVTCSKDNNSDLFHGVLGGLGQFGIITRARIALDPAPQRARWVRLIYTEFADFTRDQEHLISLGGSDNEKQRGFDYVEGSLFVGQSPINSWRSSFFSGTDLQRINSLSAAKYQRSQRYTLYCIEGSMYYDAATGSDVDKEMELLLEDLNFVPGFAFTNDVSYLSFLDRVHDGEMNLRSKGLWDVPHPWLNVFVPKSRISDFDEGVFKKILHHHKSMGPILIFPLNKTKWDERTSAVIPEEEEEEVFYSVGLLRSAISGDWKQLDEQNKEILRFCDQEGIKVKQYMPRYRTRGDWMRHFGRKWDLFLERKTKYDPKAILSPGQGIFTLQVGDQISYLVKYMHVKSYRTFFSSL